MRGRRRQRKKNLRNLLARLRADKVSFWRWYAKAHSLPSLTSAQAAMLGHPGVDGHSPLRATTMRHSAYMHATTLAAHGAWSDA